MAIDPAVPVQRQNNRYAWWVCLVMCLCFTFSYMDRAVLPLLVGPLEKSLGLTDTTISLLQGAAFAVFYASFGFPLARASDNGNRRNLIMVGVVVWGISTIACGLAQTVPQLFAGRISVAIGEAVLQPAAVSILADYFSPSHRTRALSVYSMGVFFGGGLALGLGGTLLRAVGPHGLLVDGVGHLEAWRIVFVVLGAASFVLLPLLLGVREPQRLSNTGARMSESTTTRQVLAEFARKRGALLATVFGFATVGLGGTTMQVWVPTMFVRVHGWNLGQAGQRLGLASIVLSPTGAIVGALLADRIAKGGRSDAKLIVGMISATWCAFASFLVTILPATPAFIALASMNFMIGFNFGLVQAALTELVPNRMRGVATACYIAMSNLVAAAFGPLIVGLLNDHYFHDPAKIAVSIRIVAPAGFALAAVFLASGLGSYRRAIAQPV